MKLRSLLLFAFLSIFFASFAQDITVRGTVFDKDSITPMQFAYVVNKNSGTGTLTDAAGKFMVHVQTGDTLSFSSLGYEVTRIFTHLLSDSIKNKSLTLKVFLKQKTSVLNTVTISNRSFTKEEKEYYHKKADEYHRAVSNPFVNGTTGAGLSIDAIYYTFSKRGKQLQKLSEIYQQLLIDEVREHRLSDEKIRMITSNDTLNVEAFMKYCFLPDQFILSASDYELFLSINKYYKQYVEDRKKKK